MLKGEIEVITRDALTGEIIDRVVQPNIVTNRMFEALVANSSTSIMGKTIVATSAILYPSRIGRTLPFNNGSITSVIGTAIPGAGSPDFFPANLPTAAFAQFSTRLGLPVVNRTIATVILTETGVTQLYLDAPGGSSYSNSIYAFSKLNTPCIQTPTQFLDIYYRIFFPSTNLHDMPYWSYESCARRMAGDHASVGDYRIYQTQKTSVLPLVTPNAGEEELVWPSWSVMNSLWTYLGATTVNASSFYRRKYTASLALGDFPGTLIGNIHMSSGDNRIVSASTPVINPQKIQNLLGHRAASTKTFLDIDALQQGTGTITLTGAWTNRGTPSSPGLYATGKFPEMKFINISGSGGVGVAGYTYAKRPFLGVTSYGSTYINNWRCPIAWLPYISQSRTGTIPASHAPEVGNNLMGDLTKFGVRQLSSCCKYDNTSVVIVKQDQIILYNIATGTYWRYTAAYTNITQVAVVSGKIYVSCRNTGLWMIDPANSSTVTSLASPGGGIDLSVTFGVARGASNNLLVVGNNCIARYDGATWTKYDSVSVPPFNIAGVSDANYANVEYLVVDIESANFEMLLVRRYDASVNPTSLGVWWSTATVALNGPTHTIVVSSQAGNPRINRAHIGGRASFWLMMNAGSYHKLTFNSAVAPTLVSGATANPFNEARSGSVNSIMFVKDSGSVTRWLSLANTSPTSETLQGNYSVVRPTVRLIDSALAISASVASSMSWWVDAGGSIIEHDTPAHSGIGNTSSYDTTVCFELQPGVIFSMAYCSFASINAPLKAYVGVYPFDVTKAGGALAYLGQSNYGWTGAAWSTAIATPRTVHATTETLDDGVSIAFANGVSGTSFVSTDYYNFVCAEGLQKDSATTATFEYSFYYKKAYRTQTILNQATIPVVATLAATGIVGLDTLRSQPTSGITVNGSNQFVFAGQNPQQAAVGDKQVTGNFEVEYTPLNNALAQNICFGVGHASTGMILYGFVIDANAIRVYTGGTAEEAVRGPFENASIGGSVGTFSTATSLKIRKVGGAIQFVVNGSQVATVTPPAGQLRYDLICSPWSTSTNTTWLANRICPATTIISNGSDNAIRTGTMIGGTASYNPLFYAIDTDSRGALSVLINGVAAIAYRVAGEAPGASEVTVDPYMGTLHFNAADAGKTVSAIYTYLTHE